MKKAFSIFILCIVASCFPLYCEESNQFIEKYSLRNEEQKQYFLQDPFFRVCYEIFNKNIDNLESFFKEYTYIIIKPDALVSGSFDQIKNVLNDCGFEIVAFDQFAYTPHIVKIFWYNETRLFPVDWSRLFELVLTNKTSLVFLLRDIKPDPTISTACERLSSLKGSSEGSKRLEWHIRTRIGAKSGPFGFIHTPDNPPAMIRELGVILSADQCKQLITSGIKNFESEALEALKKKIYSKVAIHDLDYTKTKDRLRQYGNLLESPTREMFLQFVNDENMRWQDFLDFVEKSKLNVPEWDSIVFCVNRKNW